MCGIVGYVGIKDPQDVVVEGLKRLEYRGYDSAGVAAYFKQPEKLHVIKTVGGVDALEQSILDFDPDNQLKGCQVMIGHTRWATHGAPSINNSHPHISNDGRYVLVHNGIIENYDTLKKLMQSEGYEFYSDTDTEVLVNWIQYCANNSMSLADIVHRALQEVIGAYAILVIDKLSGTLVATRKSSPLAIGIGNDEFIIASDATPIIKHTKDVVYLEDGQIAMIELSSDMNGSSPSLDFIDNQKIYFPEVEHLEMDLESIEKGGYDSFMLKEIFEQPETVTNCLRGRLTDGDLPIMLGGAENVMPQLLRANRIFIIACGTSWHAALVGKTMIEDLCRIPVEVDYASEFRYRNPIIKAGDVVISISQSGETADTKAAMSMAKERGATLFGIVNVVGSSIARMADSGIYTHSGVEIGVASTKAFTGQITALSILALKMARQLNSLADHDYLRIKQALHHLPEKMAAVLDQSEKIFEIADHYANLECAKDFLYLGRGINFPIALEGALKLKEISYLHAEGYPAGEMKHGPIALIDHCCPSVFVAPADQSYDKVLSNMQEIKARGGDVIAIVTEGDQVMSQVADHVIEVKETHPLLTPLLTVLPLQLFSYRMATQLKKNVDKPRNLAKSVTVE